MKIFSQDQIYEGDKITAEKQQISSTELMERAGTHIFDWIHSRMQGAQVPIHVFCGIGNNGGDGLVISRHLINHGYNVYTYIVNYSDKRSKDFLINYERLKNTTKNWPELMSNAEDLPVIGETDIIIDAIFGIGLNRPPDDWVIELFKHLKKSEAYTLSVDIPSGLCEDEIPVNDDAVVWADHTLSFQSPKIVFFLPQTAKFTGQWEVLDIGIDSEYIKNTETIAELIGKYEVLPLYKPRERFSHKGTYGHALIIGGSYGKMGAMILASKAALRTGAGLVTAYVPSVGYSILQTAIPEVMVLTDKAEKLISKINVKLEYSCVGIGPGLGTDKITVDAFEAFIKINKKPMVIDADALNILSKNKAMLKLLPKDTILTPHPKELERLIGKWKDDFEKLKKTRAFAKKYKVIIVLKGANTITATTDKLYINTTGNQGLATGGTGDVLTGIITGFLAQGYEALHSAIFGVFLHGKSADLVVESTSYQSMIATDVINGLGKAYLDLFKQPEPDKKTSRKGDEEE
ncbi:yjeF C-terminal region, hydroxyethylthiazole kinase-related/yjeF N-terminal region [Flavobacteriaceae bacterium MAR_2010_188]|nr:yjeF C-terminal region, hydroxyethylthiazole kinase-related/yjeF N-terminal region [Flavobacteriaceae bacterium MAR_2010_188]